MEGDLQRRLADVQLAVFGECRPGRRQRVERDVDRERSGRLDRRPRDFDGVGDADGLAKVGGDGGLGDGERQWHGGSGSLRRGGVVAHASQAKDDFVPRPEAGVLDHERDCRRRRADIQIAVDGQG